MNKFKNGLKSYIDTTKYEFVRVSRNKILLGLLVVFSIVIVMLMSNVSNTIGLTVAIYPGGSDINESNVIDIMDEFFDNSNNIIVNSVEDGKDMLKRSEARVFIEINTETNPNTIIVHYDSAVPASQALINNISYYQKEKTYEEIKTFFEEYGIKLNENYFESVTYEAIGGTKLSGEQRTFSNAISTTLSIVVMFGLSYSISRDNETRVSRNLAYLPMSAGKYLLSKITPYFTIGLLEIIVLMFIGRFIYNIHFQTNIVILVLLCMLFIFAVCCLGVLLSLCKSQIVATLLQVSTIVIPLYILSITFIESSPILIRILLYLLPTALFPAYLNNMMFNGTIVWLYVLLFALQAMVYLVISYLIVRKRARG